MRWMETERTALVDTFRMADPEAPTLCEGWNVRRLLAHLVQREHMPWRRLMDVAGKAEPGHEKQLSALVATAQTTEGYQALLAKFAAGTGALNPMTWLGDAGQLLEYVVHHEDARRGAGPVEPRVLPEAELTALFKHLPLMAKLSYRASPVGVSVARPDSEGVVVRKGENAVVITAEPVELALYLSGRRAAADVHITGTDESVSAFTAWVGRNG
ncbi:TIGR03085 family metal-binding protein [Arthrobacter sp. GMC3]|uniref:TIGR03085 family metal-binding protein n=1 Tax=Arthrobacter sp. GMC3 TaxID=2058894 RepID=UPI000CE437AA|nr:TIGR03085 family metal-binding protein [Arthrobacter sp. GMC3]